MYRELRFVPEFHRYCFKNAIMIAKAVKSGDNTTWFVSHQYVSDTIVCTLNGGGGVRSWWGILHW